MTLTDNEMQLLRETVKRGIAALDADAYAALPYKVRKVLRGRWDLPGGPLKTDENRRPA
jgi:hypothetical protein